MENKKLLKYLLKDLSELDEMFSEKGKTSFDDLEMEFIQNRVSGAKKLVELFIDHAIDAPANIQRTPVMEEIQEDRKHSGLTENTTVMTEDKLPDNSWGETEKAIKHDEKMIEINVTQSESVKITESEPVTNEKTFENVMPETKVQEIKVIKQSVSVQRELKLEEEESVDIHHKTLGDSFLKEKSVNDLIGDDFSKLEHKLSNRPVSSIQAAIGINDRFQYIRELFEGSTENFAKTVADLDSMNDIKEAVNYLQTHFKWKKNETSLKFVSLIKRRFPNE